MRTGTSMMMEALQAGGLPLVYETAREQFLSRHADEHYQPNQHLYECTTTTMKQPTWPRQHDGCCLKVLGRWLEWLAVAEYRVIVMTRPAEEIRQSLEGAFGIKESVETINVHAEMAVESLANRRDVVSLDTLSYHEVLANPHGCLASLDWPIDVDAAAAMVNPMWHRFRMEKLTVGL